MVTRAFKDSIGHIFKVIKEFHLVSPSVRAVLSTLLVGIPCSITLAWHLLQLENHKEIADYNQQIDQVMSIIEQELRGDENILMSAAFFLNVENNASPETFEQFMTPYLVLRPEIGSVTWIPYVTDKNLPAFEEK